jgi:hypothetical protein
MGVELGLYIREEHWLRVFEYRVLRGWTEQQTAVKCNEQLHALLAKLSILSFTVTPQPKSSPGRLTFDVSR